MRPIPRFLLRPAVALAGALLLGACGGDPEKEALGAYEASVESLMGEDARVSARLSDLRSDLATQNARAEDQSAYARDVALPFYRRFRGAAEEAPAETDALRRIHGRLREYLAARLAYLEAFERVLGITEGAELAALRRSEPARNAARKDLVEKTGGKIEDRDVQEAWTIGDQFASLVYGPFQAGRVPLDRFQAALRGEVIPRFARLADRTGGEIAAEGPAGAVARWAATEAAFYRQLAEAAPVLSGMFTAGADVGARWDEAEELRAKFLEELRSHRDSLR